jgi:hypothetical protein
LNAKAKILNRTTILAADDVKTQLVSVPEWGGSVYVSSMTGAMRDAWEQMLVKDGASNIENARAKLLVVSVVDEGGNRVFSDADIDALGQKSASALNRLALVAQKLSRIGERELEDAIKN